MNVVQMPVRARPDIHAGPLVLVNRDHPVHADAPLRLVALPGGHLLEHRAAAFFTALCDEVNTSDIRPVSGYRSREEQRALYENSIRDNGPLFTSRYVALPGHSEHETGLAIDVGANLPDLDPLRPAFPYDGICGRFRALAPEYGFIERYPQGKEEITGIAHEPWHFRYVGFPHARIMADHGLTLEEYHGRLRAFPYGSAPLRVPLRGLTFSISFLAADGDAIPAPESDGRTSISGNNRDGYIVTRWEVRR